MASVLVNPAGNTPQGIEKAQGDPFTFAPAPEPGPRHGDGVVLLYSSLPAAQDEHPAADGIQGNLIGTETLGARRPSFRVASADQNQASRSCHTRRELRCRISLL